MADETVVKNWSPAFPLTFESPDGSVTTFQGMTLRDYFAGRVLAGMYSNPSFDEVTKDVLATVAYEQADDMLKARGEC